MMRDEMILSFDTATYPFDSIVREMFDVNVLEKVHELDPNASVAGYVPKDNDQATVFHKTFYDSSHIHRFRKVYNAWIKEVIGTFLVF